MPFARLDSARRARARAAAATSATRTTDASEERASNRDHAIRDRWLLATALLTVAPLFVGKYLPFTDLPEHVATVATLRHWYDPAWHDGQTYVLALSKSSYIAFHLIGALLSVPLGSAELAVRVLTALAGLALPYAVRALLRALRGDERLAVLACPLFWCRPLIIGFLPYMAALPVAITTIALAIEQLRRPSAARAWGLVALSIFTFYLHVSAFAILVLVASVFTVVPIPDAQRSRWTTNVGRLAWLVPSFVLVAVWAVRAAPNGGPELLASDSAVRYVPPRELGSLFAAWTHDIWHGRIDDLTGVVFWLLVAWLGLQRSAPEPGGGWAVAARLTPFACVFVLYFVMPFKIGAGAMLNVRLAVLLGLFVLLVPRPDPTSRLPFVCASILSIVVAANAAREIRATAPEIGDFEKVLAAIRPGSRLLALHFKRASDHTQPAAWVHAGAYHRTRQGGVASLSFSEMGHWPIQYRPEARPPKKAALFWDFEPCLFRNTVDGRYYDFILVRGDAAPVKPGTPGPVWRPVVHVDDWSVFEKVPDAVEMVGTHDDGPCAP